jgi:hypothetical protein
MTHWSGPAETYQKRARELHAEAQTVSNVYVRNALLEEAARFEQLGRLLDKEASERMAKKPNLSMTKLPRHRCFIYAGSPARQLRAIARVMRAKLSANYRCLYLNSPPMVAGIRSYLAASGVDVIGEIDKAALVLSFDQGHLQDDVFVPDRMLGMLDDAVAQALDDGFDGLWASGDMSWEFGPERDFSKLVEYERGLERIFSKRPTLYGVCQYHSDTLPSHVLRQGLECHPAVFVSETLSQLNPQYLPP